MELPLYSADVRHRALLEHFLKTMVCGQRRFSDEVGKNYGVDSGKRYDGVSPDTLSYH